MIAVAGGVYKEFCLQPDWERLYGSAGRAVHALSGLHAGVGLHTYIDSACKPQLEALLASVDAHLVTGSSIKRTIAFHYVHPLSIPVIYPPPHLVEPAAGLTVQSEVVLRFGMLEGDAVVEGDRVVYDPQSAFDPRPFRENGSKARRLAIVANAQEVRAMARVDDPIVGARHLLGSESAEVVVVKRGGRGALVVTASGDSTVPAYRSASVFSIGSGDVFAAAFAHFWACEGLDAVTAADLSSRATSRYCETRDPVLVARGELEVDRTETVSSRDGRVYLAGPFFNIAQRWLVEEARIHLLEMGLAVFSPLHDVGMGPGDVVAQKDLDGLNDCDRVLALVDGTDPGTLFEVGYARALKLPVVALAETLSEEQLKMLVGTKCQATSDFATALYFTAWLI